MPTINKQIAASVAILAALALLGGFAIGCGGEDQADNDQNVDATIEAVVSEISATRTAESPPITPQRAPTNISRPNPTAIGVPTATASIPSGNSATAIATPTPDPLAPLSVSDTESFLSGVSGTESRCVSEAVSAGRLGVLLDSPESATEEERLTLMGCLDHETELRLFLTPVLTATGPLSAESAECLRGSFANTDVGGLMLAAASEPGANPDPEAAMARAMISSMVSLGCLSEEEFRAASPTMGANPEEYENFQCVLNELGGPERMAQLMHAGDGIPAPLFEAAFECQVQVEGAPPG